MNKTIPMSPDLMELVSSFKCGNSVLDSFIKSSESYNPYIGKTFVWLSDDATHIMGYYSICTGCVIENNSNNLLNIGGSIHINDFAVDERYHGWKIVVDNDEYNLSDVLLMDCIERIDQLHEHVGFSFITLNSTKQGYTLYQRNGFDEIEDDMYIPASKAEMECKPMYFPMEYI